MVQTCLNKHFEAHGMIHEITAPYALDKMTAERKNRIVKKMMNAMLNSLGLPSHVWGKESHLLSMGCIEFHISK